MPISRTCGVRMRSLILGSVLLLIGSSPPSCPDPRSLGPSVCWKTKLPWLGDSRRETHSPRNPPDGFSDVLSRGRIDQTASVSGAARWGPIHLTRCGPACERYSVSPRSIAAATWCVHPNAGARCERVSARKATPESRRCGSRSSRSSSRRGTPCRSSSAARASVRPHPGAPRPDGTSHTTRPPA